MQDPSGTGDPTFIFQDASDAEIRSSFFTVDVQMGAQEFKDVTACFDASLKAMKVLLSGARSTVSKAVANCKKAAASQAKKDVRAAASAEAQNIRSRQCLKELCDKWPLVASICDLCPGIMESNESLGIFAGSVETMLGNADLHDKPLQLNLACQTRAKTTGARCLELWEEHKTTSIAIYKRFDLIGATWDLLFDKPDPALRLDVPVSRTRCILSV